MINNLFTIHQANFELSGKEKNGGAWKCKISGGVVQSQCFMVFSNAGCNVHQFEGLYCTEFFQAI